MKKTIIKTKRQFSKRGNIKTPLNVSNKQDADKTNNDISNEIQMSEQILIPEEIKKKKKNKRPKPLTGVDLIKKRITFADFRKKSHELNNIKTNN
tara:strand:+ start:108 stop:392 length:285 start_codon:yes stop_codon:yes gene_type:complete